MSSLPRSRLVPAKVFQNVATDCAGPVQLLFKAGKGGKNVIKKAYIAVFVCFATKTMHLELVPDNTTENFLAAFDRFVGRRGLPTNVYSDNGGNFVGASSKPKDFYNSLEQEKESDHVPFYCSSNSVAFHTSP